MMKLVEDSSGNGELIRDGQARAVRYHVRRYQGVMEGSGLPIPGLFRIEGSVGLEFLREADDWIGASLTLKFEDGRFLGIVIADSSGRVFSEGHGPMKCLCC